jgi:uncharacterized protein
MKIVLDINVWLSGIFWTGEANKIIEMAEKEDFQIIISEEILAEIVSVLSRESKFQKNLSNLKLNIEELLRTILSISELVEPKIKLNVVKEDPKDNIILEAGLEGKAEYIISYDKHLLNMLEFRGMKIISPKKLLEKI